MSETMSSLTWNSHLNTLYAGGAGGKILFLSSDANSSHYYRQMDQFRPWKPTASRDKPWLVNNVSTMPVGEPSSSRRKGYSGSRNKENSSELPCLKEFATDNGTILALEGLEGLGSLASAGLNRNIGVWDAFTAQKTRVSNLALFFT